MADTVITTSVIRVTREEAMEAEEEERTTITVGTGVHAGVKVTHPTPPISNMVSNSCAEIRPTVMGVGWDGYREGV